MAVGERLTATAAAERPTAVFCANDLIAAGLIQVITQAGWRIPDDLAVVGFDDTDLVSAASAVELTSVRQPAAEMGSASVRLILDGTGPPRDLVFVPELIARESSVAGRA